MAAKKVEATLRSYEPSLKERLYQAVAGTEQRPSAERASFARGLSELAEFMPFLGNVLAGEEAYRRGDTKGMAMAALPMPGAAKEGAAVRALESFRPMNAFERNTYGATTAQRPYMPEMAVTDFESYGPFSREGAPAGQGANTGFDQNMYQAWLRGRMGLNRPAGGPVIGEGGEGSARMMGMGYTPEDLGQAVAPYRQGGLVYEPVGPAEPSMAQRMGANAYQYERNPANMGFGVTRDGMAVPPSGMMFDPRLAAGAAGVGYLAGLPRERETVAQAGMRPFDPTFNPNMPASRMTTPLMQDMYPLMPEGTTGMRGAVQLPPIDVFGRQGATALSGRAPGAGTAFEQPARRAPAQKAGRKAAPKGEGKKSTPAQQETSQTGAFDPNFNYLVTQAIDQMLGQREAETGRGYQDYYATNPWPY